MKRLVVQWPRLGPYHLARLRALYRQFSEAGIELIALETASRDEVYAWREEQADEPFKRVQVFPGRTFDEIPPGDMHSEVTAALNRLQPDAVAIHTYSFPDSRACVAWCRKHRRGAVVMTDSKQDDAARSWPREFIKRRVLSAYDAAVTAGSRSRAYLESLGFPGERIWLGYDVVDNDYFARAAADAPRPAGLHRPYFLASNRFILRKNLPLLLDAYAAYRVLVDQPWDLVMLGDGPLRPVLESASPEGVRFEGFRQIDEIPGYYAHAEAFVHPAEVDQWALVINEAMACGLPIIASTGAGATHDLVGGGVNGFAFEPEDRRALRESLRAMHDVDRDAMGEASRRIIAEWGPELFAASMLSAARAAAEAGNRRFGPVQRLVLTTLRLATRSTTSFHAIES
ncbi:MAG: glycosyltransferase family 4 protein [Rhodothermales bacterium]|nr:glycosyltransferase family 4 protein [Rhodothermales bacterium]MBO6781090.1 glycosyltransferase family 4 protein [Rhodothermales bacterium]